MSYDSEKTPVHKLCSGPPPIDMTIKVNNPDHAYLYRAIHQDKTDLAIDWLNRWKDTHLKDVSQRTSVLWECVKIGNEKLINYLLENELVTSDQVEKAQNDWHRIKSD